MQTGMDMLIRFRISFFVVVGFCLLTSGNSLAQSQSPDVTLSLPALGSDVWNGLMGRRGHFIPDPDDCDSATEAHVAIIPNGRGFCIEIDQRAPKSWDGARHECLQENKRLPEPAEFKFACEQAAQLGLNDMVGDFEWASNFTFPIVQIPQTREGIGAAIIGEAACNHGSFGWVTNNIASTEPTSFRCVR